MAKGVRRIRIFSALEVANICGVVNQTAINWIRSKHLKAFTTPGGQYRIYAKDLAAFLDKRGMGASEEVLQVMMDNADWDCFMVAAESPLNGSLTADIRRLFPDYTIIQAHDWFEVGRKFAEQKPGILLLDAGLPGVNISKFIHTVKTDPVFGRPYIILLTDGKRNETREGKNGPGAKPVELRRADVVLSKPLDLGKLEAAIKTLEKALESAASA